MKRYKYLAKNNMGKSVKGSIEANDVSDFYKKLGAEELLCSTYSEEAITEAKIKTHYKLKIKDMVMFCRKLSTMLNSGMSITNSIDIMCTSVENPKLTKIYYNLYESIRGGKSLSSAMKENGEAFPILMINMFESGEESGNIDLMCSKLAIYYEKQAKISAKVKTATIYPKILTLLTLAVVIILFTFVLPSIFDTFAGMELPWITQVMLAISDFLVEYWYFVLLGGVVAVLILKSVFSIPSAKRILDEIVVKIPKIGKLVSKIYAARFASTLSVLYSSGLSLLNGIRLSIGVIGNRYIEEKLGTVMEKVSLGQSLSETILEENVFDKLLPSMIRIGEESGSLDSVLNSVSDYYEQETETAIEGLLAIMEPLLLIVLAVVIGSVLISVMVPIFQGYGEIG